MADSTYALLTDGATVEIRPARPGDFAAVRDMHAKMSPDNLYLRFFSMSPNVAEQEAHRICREPGPDHAALLALLDGEVVGCGSYDCIGVEARSAEVAFTVADDLHHHGIGMLLLEHLVSLARGRGISAFTAETLSENAAMLRVFADAGLQAQRSLVDGVYDIKFPLPADEADAALGTYRDTVALRERSADVASMRHVLTPASVAVVGASSRPRVDRAHHPAQHRHQRFRRAGSTRSTRTRSNWTASDACRPRPPCPTTLTWRSSPCRRCRRARCRRGHAGGGESRPWWWSRPDSAARPAPNCSASAAAMACGWSGRPATAWPTRHRPGRDVRGPPSAGGNGRPGAAVHRRHRFRPARAPVPAGRGHLLPGLLRRQRRRVRHRHAAVVGGRRADQAGPAVPGIDREPAQVRPHRSPRRPHHTRADRGRGPVRDRQAPDRGARHQGRYPTGHSSGPVRADRHHRRR